MTQIDLVKPVTFPPSSAHIWGTPDGCPAYRHAVRAYPYQANADADEGKRAHAIGAQWLKVAVAAGALVRADVPGITDEMARGVTSYVSDALAELTQGVAVTKFGIEQKLYLRNIHADRCTGYIDWWWRSESVISVWDFKYGFGVVEPEGNRQLIAYMSALLRMFGVTPEDPATHNIECRMHIHQPRAMHPRGSHRVWVTTPAEVFAIEAELKRAAEQIDAGNVYTRSGNHCRYCPARLDCPAARKSAMESIAYIDAPRLDQYTCDQLGEELLILERANDVIFSRTKTARAELEARMKRGERCSQWLLSETQSSMYWDKGGAGTVRAMGFDVMNEPKPQTPKQVIESGVPESVVKMYARRSAGVKLVRENGRIAKELKGKL